MKLIFTLVGLGLALASGHLPQANPLTPETEYRFKYEATLISGLPVPSTDSSLTRIRAEAFIQVSDRVGRLQLRKIEIANDKSQELTSELVPMERLEKRELTEEHKSLLEKPVRFHYKNGLVSELQFTEEDQPWSENMKRAVLNMIQVNLNKGDDMENSWDSGYFTTFEKTIEGECEVVYTIVPETEKTLVTKSVNFDKCERRPDAFYNQRFTTECPECDYKMIVPQTVYNYKFNREELEQVEVRSVYTVSLKNQPLMKTEVVARLEKLEKKDINREIESARGEKKELIYSNQWERSMEEFFKLGDDAQEKPFEMFPKKVEQIQEFVSKIAELRENTPETTHMFTRLIRTLRMCSESELRRVHEKIESRAEKKEKSIIEHALAIAGTKNTVQHLLSHMEEIKPIKLSQLLKSIQETPLPSMKIAHLLQKLAESDRAQREPMIRQSAWLAYGAVVRGAVVKTQDKHYLPQNEETTKIASVFRKLWEQSEDIYEKVLAVKTMANSGLDRNIVLLQKIINDKKEHTVVRMEAIDALRLLSEQMPRKIQSLLMPVYTDRLEKNEIRMAALNQLVQAKPALPVLSQIVSRMEREPNQHVAAFTYHLLNSLVESPLPFHRNISAMCSTLVRNSQYRPEPRFLSLYKRMPLFSEESRSGLNLNLGSVFGKDSMIPKDMMVALDTLFGGNWNKYLAQVGVSQQNIEVLFNKIISRLSKWEKKESISRASRVSLKKSVVVLKDLAKELNIRVRESRTEEPFAMLYIRYKQMDFAVFPLTDKYIDELIHKVFRDGRFELNDLERFFDREPEFDVTHAGIFIDSYWKMPTTAGLPLTITAKLPTVFSATGKFSMERINYGIKARLQAQPTMASTHVHAMSLWTPVFEHGVKIIRTAQLATPIDFELDISYKNELEITLKQKMPEEEKTLIRVDTRPVSFVRWTSLRREDQEKYIDAEESTIRVPRLERLNQEKTMKYELQGLEFLLTGSNYRLWTKESLLLGEHHAHLIVKPTSRMPKEITSKIMIGEIKEGRMEAPKVEKMIRKEMETEEGEWESRSVKSSRREHFDKIVRNMKLDRAYNHLVKVEIRGKETTEMTLRTECEENVKFCRLTVKINPEGSRRQWNVKSELEVVLPRPVASLQELKEQLHREVQIHLETQWGSEERNTFEILAQLEQSREQRNLVKKSNELRGVSAHEQLIRVARLNQLKARVNYELSPESQKYFEEIFGVLKAYTYWNSNVEMADNQKGQLFIQVTAEPLVPSLFNVSVQTPETSYIAKSVRLPIVPAVVLPSIARQPKNMIRHSTLEKSECQIEGGRITTFDDAIYSVPMSSCYTVVAKDCSSAEPRYAVLIKNAKRNGEEKKMKIIFEETEMELEVVEDDLKLNGKTIRDSAELENNRIEKIGDLYIIDLDEIVVRFDGYTAKVLLSNGEMETQCGLCGHFDGEKKNDYRTADDEETDDIEAFHRSYVLKTDECSAESSKTKKSYRQYSVESSEEDNEWEPKKYRKVPVKTSTRSEEYDDEEKKNTIEPEEKILLKEYSNRMCFSLEPVKDCPKRSDRTQTYEKKVRYGCLNRSSVQTRKLVEAVRRGEIIKTSHIPMSFVENELVPKSCVEAY